jgi:hypothetical protein
MGRAIKIGAALLPLTLFLIFSMHVSVYGQQQPSGVVTAVQGQAQLTRPAVAKPTLLRQKDGVMIRDVSVTREKSMARVLFGGKATITLKELSRFEVREETLPGGATRSTVELNSGALLINVARELMKPGDEVIIRTDNAIAAVRGSMIYAETHEPGQSTFAQLSGEAVLTCSTSSTSATVNLTRFTATDVKGPATNCNLGTIRTITEEFAAILLRSFQLPRAVAGEGNRTLVLQNAAADTTAISDAALAPGTAPQLPPIIQPPPKVQILPAGVGAATPPAGGTPLPPPIR